MTQASPTDVIHIEKKELKELLREIVREVLREELNRFPPIHKEEQATAPSQATASSTLGALYNSEFFGMWRDREDLPDSSILAREWRDKAWRKINP
jgi:hypothetical protein